MYIAEINILILFLRLLHVLKLRIRLQGDGVVRTFTSWHVLRASL